MTLSIPLLKGQPYIQKQVFRKKLLLLEHWHASFYQMRDDQFSASLSETFKKQGVKSGTHLQ